jgi:origin recognition complex subunit 3
MFDVDFEQDIVIGPAVIDSLSDFFTRHNSSLDALITILHVRPLNYSDTHIPNVFTRLGQLAHLKHFDDPLTIFVHDNGNLSSLLLQPTSFPFLDHLLTRISAPPASASAPPSPTHSTAWLNQSVPSLLASIDEARTEFRTKMRKTKVALGLMKRVKEFMLKQGWRSADERSQVELMLEALKGRLGRDGRYLGTMVK